MKRITRASLLALALLAGAAPLASRAMPGGPGPHGGPGFGMPLALTAELKARLALDTTQQGQWDKALAQSKAAREAARASRAQARAALDAELAKAEPDLAAVARAAESARQGAASLARQAREEWLALYAILRPDQKLVIRDGIVARLQRADAMRERIKQHQGVN